MSPLILAMLGLISSTAGQTHRPPKLTFAYSVSSGTQAPVDISTPFGNDRFYYFDNNTISGPLINATTARNAGVATLPVENVDNSTSFLFTARSQGITSDGVPFWIEDDGVATAGSSPVTFDQQTWYIGGKYSYLSLSKIWCYGAENEDGSITNDCYIAS